MTKGFIYLNSPHIRTIRERITLGTIGEPVSAKALSSHFHKIKEVLEMAVKLEKGHLSQFEVYSWMDKMLLMTYISGYMSVGDAYLHWV